MALPQTFTIRFFSSVDDVVLEDSGILFDLYNDVNNIDYKNLNDYLSALSIIYNNFIVTKPVITNDLDERIYFISPGLFDSNLEMIRNKAKEGDLIDFEDLTIDTIDPKYISKKYNNLIIVNLVVYLDQLPTYLLPKEAMYVVFEYNVHSIYDIERLYPTVNIVGIYIPIFYLPESDDPNERRDSIPYLFATKKYNNFTIEFRNQHFLYLKSI